MAFEPIDIRERLRRRQGPSDYLAAPAPAPEAPAAAPTVSAAPKSAKSKTEVNKRMLLLALGTAALASLLIVNYLRSSAGILAAQSKLIKVPVLAQDVSSRSVITAEMITYKEIPALYVTEGTATAEDKLAGKVALADLFKGEPVMSKRVSDPNGDTGVAVKIPVGHRAMAVDNQLDGLLKPGDYVDVYATLTDTAGKQHTEPVLQHSQVLAVGNRIGAEGKDEVSTNSGKATLAVADDKVHLMTILEEKGNFRLVLRAPNDTSKSPQKFSDKQLLTMLTGPDEAPRPKAPPKPVAPVYHAPVYRPQVVERRVAVSHPAPPKPAPVARSPVVVTVINGGNVEQQAK